jgi:hypothetical protein
MQHRESSFVIRPDDHLDEAPGIGRPMWHGARVDTGIGMKDRSAGTRRKAVSLPKGIHTPCCLRRYSSERDLRRTAGSRGPKEEAHPHEQHLPRHVRGRTLTPVARGKDR